MFRCFVTLVLSEYISIHYVFWVCQYEAGTAKNEYSEFGIGAAESNFLVGVRAKACQYGRPQRPQKLLIHLTKYLIQCLLERNTIDD